MKRLGCLVLSLLLISDIAFAAAPKGSVKLSSDKLFQKSSRGKTFTCGNLPPWSSGRMVSGSFYPTKVEIASLKAKAKKAASSSRKALESKIKSLTAYLNTGKVVCRSGPPGGSTPTPTPTAPPSGNSFFDSMGRVTAAGKVAFGIPSNFSASVNSGIGAWQHTCASCHGSSAGVLRTTSFGGMKSRIQLSPMSFSIPAEITEQQIADIVAYANY